MVRRSQSVRPPAAGAHASTDTLGSESTLVEAPAAEGVTVTGRGGSVRRVSKRLTRFVADGTGRSEAEIQVLIVAGAVPVLVASTMAVSRGVLRLVDFLADG
jgi:hypothetical protein